MHGRSVVTHTRRNVCFRVRSPFSCAVLIASEVLKSGIETCFPVSRSRGLCFLELYLGVIRHPVTGTRKIQFVRLYLVFLY